MRFSSMRMVGFVAALAAIAGCFTISQSEYPEASLVKAAAGREVVVRIAGFETDVTTYAPVFSYVSGWSDGPDYPYWPSRRHGRHRHYDGPYSYAGTVTTYVPHTAVSGAYADRAREMLEDAGYVVSSDKGRWQIEVKFDGPRQSGSDQAKEMLCVLFSVFTADWVSVEWSAKLTVRDLQTGRVAMRRQYSQRYTASSWGAIPVVALAGNDVTHESTARDWCLSALSDRALADATVFLQEQAE